jgi:hypothetical protein
MERHPPSGLTRYLTECLLSDIAENALGVRISPESVRVTLLRVSLPPTLFRQSTWYSTAEALWGTSHRLTDRLRGNCGSEGWRGRFFAVLVPKS